jgi:hypothetical protein
MADIALSDQLHVFMRKIGWSAGLESTLDRLIDLASVYAENGELRISDWNSLVQDKWELKLPDNIGDFFSALDVVKRARDAVHVMPGLDMLGILRRELPEDDLFRKAASFVLLFLVVENDGEIFLNAFAQEFRQEAVERALINLIQFKREVLFSIYKVPGLQQKISQIVNVERQRTNVGSSGAGRTLELQKRAVALSTRREPLVPEVSTKVSISPDYYRKVLPKRKEWAKSIGLCTEKGVLTDAGRHFLGVLMSAGWTTPTGEFVLWPLTHEVLRLRLNAGKLSSQVVDFWTFVATLARGLGVDVAEGATSDESAQVVLDRLRKHAALYSTLNRPKALLRREYPATVAYPTLAALAFAQGEQLPEVPDILERERMRPERTMELRSSQTSIATLVFRR